MNKEYTRIRPILQRARDTTSSPRKRCNATFEWKSMNYVRGSLLYKTSPSSRRWDVARFQQPVPWLGNTWASPVVSVNSPRHRQWRIPQRRLCPWSHHVCGLAKQWRYPTHRKRRERCAVAVVNFSNLLGRSTEAIFNAANQPNQTKPTFHGRTEN